MSVLGDFIHNTDAKKDDTGWLIGGKLGHASVRNPGQWQGMYTYRKFEKDAWLDIFPDSDFYGGDTGVKGHEIKFQYGLLKNVNLGLTYYGTQNISGTKRKEDLFMADLVFKF